MCNVIDKFLDLQPQIPLLLFKIQYFKTKSMLEASSKSHIFPYQEHILTSLFLPSTLPWYMLFKKQTKSMNLFKLWKYFSLELSKKPLSETNELLRTIENWPEGPISCCSLTDSLSIIYKFREQAGFCCWFKIEVLVFTKSMPLWTPWIGTYINPLKM